MFKSNNDTAPFAPRIHIGMRLDNLFQRILPIDHGLEFSRLSDLFEYTQILGPLSCQPGADHLAACQ